MLNTVSYLTLLLLTHVRILEWRHIKEIPRVTSKGVLCGSVYRIESEKDLSNVAES